MIGVVGAIGAIVAAVVAVLQYVDDRRDRDRPQHIVIDNAPAPAPQEEAEVDPASLGQAVAVDDVPTDVQDPAVGCAAGDPFACANLLDGLADECYAGDGFACDLLYLYSPFGSVYEDYGATCGYRAEDWTFAGACSA